MMTSTQIKVVISLAVVIWGVLLFLQGVRLKTDYLKPYSIVVGGVILVGTLYDLYLWRTWPFSLFGPRPVLRGTWRGQLKSTWQDAKTRAVSGWSGRVSQRARAVRRPLVFASIGAGGMSVWLRGSVSTANTPG